MNLVWFKNDLRVFDHKPFVEASKGNCLGLYIIEPEWLEDIHTGKFHKIFLRECLLDLKQYLNQYGVSLLVKEGAATEVIQEVIQDCNIEAIYSHMQTGLNWTFKRDLKIKELLGDLEIPWNEYKQFGNTLTRNICTI